MATIEKSIEVNVPEYTAYAQWTHFEEFPQFMEGVKEVKRRGVMGSGLVITHSVRYTPAVWPAHFA